MSTPLPPPPPTTNEAAKLAHDHEKSMFNHKRTTFSTRTELATPHIATAHHQRSRTASASKSSSPLPSAAGTIPAQSSSVGA